MNIAAWDIYWTFGQGGDYRACNMHTRRRVSWRSTCEIAKRDLADSPPVMACFGSTPITGRMGDRMQYALADSSSPWSALWRTMVTPHRPTCVYNGLMGL